LVFRDEVFCQGLKLFLFSSAFASASCFSSSCMLPMVYYFMYSPSHAILIAHSHENACFIVHRCTAACILKLL
jgi:hypothetical protein